MKIIKDDICLYELDDSETVLKKIHCLMTDAFATPSNIKVVGKYSFANFQHLKSITIPCTVEEIEDGAFYNCSQLTFVRFESREIVLNLGRKVFGKCISLLSLDLPSSVSLLDKGDFDGCYSLKRIFIPDSVTNVDGNVFSGLMNLERIDVSESNNNFQSVDGVLLSKDELIKVPASYIPSTSNDIDSSVESVLSMVSAIHQNALEGTAIKRITIPSSIRFIDYYAFKDCKSLEYINLHKSQVNWLRMGIFKGCSNLERIAIPLSVTGIGPSAFEECSKLKRILLPHSIWRINRNAFAGCSSLREVYFYRNPSFLNRIIVDEECFHLPDDNGITYYVRDTEFQLLSPLLHGKAVKEMNAVEERQALKSCFFH